MDKTLLDPIKEKLQTAVELELATIPPYLTAMFSIRPGTNSAAAGIIRSVFMEEMLHLLLAANVLSAIDGNVRLGEKNIPVYPLTLNFKGQRFRDRHFEVGLEKFSPASLKTFLAIELPEFIDPQELKVMSLDVDGFTIGEFYQRIIADLEKLCAENTEAEVFCGSPKKQVSEEFYWRGGGKPIVVRSMADARQAMELIIAQGEGVSLSTGHLPATEELPHYFRFREIEMARLYQPGDDLLGDPTGESIDIDYTEVFNIMENPKAADYTGFEEIAFLNSLFNVNYSQMLNQLEQGFNGNPALFYTAILNGMHKLSPVAASLVQMPLPDNSGRNAAPTYEWKI